VDTPDLVYDAELAANALAWSTYLANLNDGNSSITLVHSSATSSPPRDDEGENLAWSSNVRPGDWSATAWYDEIVDYDYNNPGFSLAAGHFTALIWASSTKVGCADVDNFVTCRYFP